jgi:hypothetical protein
MFKGALVRVVLFCELLALQMWGEPYKASVEISPLQSVSQPASKQNLQCLEAELASQQLRNLLEADFAMILER